MARRATTALVGFAMVCAIGAGVVGLHWRANAVPPAAALPPLTVVASPLTIEPNYEIAHRYVGRIEPARTTRIAFERAGLVTEVNVDEGDSVSAGQVLARLDLEPLEVERRRLVAEGDQIEARLAFAKRTLERRSSLAGQAVSKQLFDEVRFEAKALEAQIETIEARIAAIDIDIAKSTLKAPFAGTLAGRFLDDGAVVAAGTEVVRLLETGRLQARIGLPPEVAETLTDSTPYRLRTQGRDVFGTLATLRPDLETSTRTVVALFDIADPGIAAAGELIELFLPRSVPGPGAWVPVAALEESAKGLWSIFAVVDGNDGPEVAREAVEVVHTADQRAFVRGTFGPRARIVVGGTNRITPGQRVVVAED